MYAPYIPPSDNDFDLIFTPSIRGGGLSDINYYTAPRIYQRGGSFLSILGRVIRGSIPILKNLFLPEIPRFISNIKHDVNSGVNFGQSLKSHGVESIKNISKSTYNKLRGGGRNLHKIKNTNTPRMKKKRKIKKHNNVKLINKNTKCNSREYDIFS